MMKSDGPETGLRTKEATVAFTTAASRYDFLAFSHSCQVDPVHFSSPSYVLAQCLFRHEKNENIFPWVL